ncbi:MAG TPA: retropepsin-like aspartic protease [Candidatus Acidoferrales bacterium]|nr:retropepsin-like aspartic protease [Candidatus Acidoferrales bacterium]
MLLRSAAIALGAIALFALPSASLAAAGTALDAPPPNLTPTTATLGSILAAHDKAVGTLPASVKNTVAETWTFVDQGLKGTLSLERDGTNYRSRIAAGPFVEQYGQDASGRWHQDANGFTTSTTAVDEESFYPIRVVEDAADPKNDVTVLGESAGQSPAYVLKVVRPGYEHPEYVFYDKASAMVTRVEIPTRQRRIVQTYSDFRTTDGVAAAWHVHDTDGRPELDDDYVLTSLRHGEDFPAQDFAMPPYHPSIGRVTVRTPIAAHTLGYGYLVRMNVGGRGLDFIVDSSSPDSIVDRDVAREMNLPAYGQATQTTDGKPVAYRTTIADGDVSGIPFHNFVLTAEPFGWEPDDRTKIVGALGYDFFAANVLHFDFMNGTLEALPVAPFSAGAPVPGGYDIPIQIDDGTPFVPIAIGSFITRKALLSTADPITMVFGSFVYAHPDQLQDPPGSGRHHPGRIVPFADEGTYGITVESWTSMVSDLRFAVGDYQRVGLLSTNYPLRLHEQDVDALLGLDYLGFYDLYFAYPYGRFIVKPNAAFFKVFKRD